MWMETFAKLAYWATKVIHSSHNTERWAKKYEKLDFQMPRQFEVAPSEESYSYIVKVLKIFIVL